MFNDIVKEAFVDELNKIAKGQLPEHLKQYMFKKKTAPETQGDLPSGDGSTESGSASISY